MKAETFLFPQLSRLLVKRPQGQFSRHNRFCCKMETKEKKNYQSIFRLKSGANRTMIAQSSIHGRIHKSTASTDCHFEVSILWVMLHSSSSSDGHRTCIHNSRGTSGFRFMITATLVIIWISVLVDKHFERLNNWFCKDLCSYSCLGKFKRLQNLALKIKKKFIPSIFFYCINIFIF